MAEDPDSTATPKRLEREPGTGLVTPPPVQMNARRIVAGGALLFLVAFLALLPFYGWLGDHDHRLWLWTCLTGTVQGLLGWSIMERHRRVGRTI